ncbi:putative ABC transporter permease [Huintestinicola sp.]|uniref:putative ABC transporter permease n=1 Tax=Huintestinicola sp. TaxID=2981661 RepID=UPI003D7E47DE
MIDLFFEKISFFGFSLYEMCLLFLIWSFIGWAIEVCAHALKMGEYSNRGFLSMPICPIYGVGVLIITIILGRFMDLPIVVFILSSLICTAFELAVGVLMKLIFHNMWWDYSDEHFNFKGYICLKVSIEWGLGCLIVEYCAEPWIEGIIGIIPRMIGVVVIIVMAVLIVIDCVNSVSAVYRLNLRLKEISEISAKMYDHSQKLGKKFADKALEAADAGAEKAAEFYMATEEASEEAERIKEEAKERMDELEDKLRSRYDALIAFSDKEDRRVIRLINAFPSLRSAENGEALEKLRASVRERLHRKKT